MSDEKQPSPTPTPEQAEAAGRLIALRREIRDEEFRGRCLHHRIRERTRKTRPVLAERAEVVAMLDEYAEGVGRLSAMRAEAARLGELLAPLVTPRRVVATVTVATSGGGGRRNPRSR
jgi:hypothetical protein